MSEPITPFYDAENCDNWTLEQTLATTGHVIAAALSTCDQPGTRRVLESLETLNRLAALNARPSTADDLHEPNLKEARKRLHAEAVEYVALSGSPARRTYQKRKKTTAEVVTLATTKPEDLEAWRRVLLTPEEATALYRTAHSMRSDYNPCPEPVEAKFLIDDRFKTFELPAGSPLFVVSLNPNFILKRYYICAVRIGDGKGKIVFLDKEEVLLIAGD